MSLQDILFYAGIAFLALGVVLGAIAAYLFFSYNIPDIIDDLSGKKRADAIARMEEPGTGMLKRRAAKPKASTPQQQPAAFVPSTEELRAAAAAAAPQPAPAQVPAAQPIVASSSPSDSVAVEQHPDVNMHYIPQQDDAEDATTVISDDVEANSNTAINAETASPSEAISEEEVAQPADTEGGAKESLYVEAADRQHELPEWFRVVRKIVLTESTGYVRIEQGEDHA